MSKIDLSLIEGYEAMSLEDKVKLLESFEFDDSELSKLREDNKKQKDLITRYTGEISSLKKAQNQGLTEAEKKAKEQEDAMLDLQSKYDALLRSSTISTYQAKYIALGYDEAMALETATALVEGDMDKVFGNSEKFKASLEKQYKAEAARAMPRPDGKGGVKSPLTKKEIMDIKDPTERQQAIAEHIELFTQGE